MRVERIGQSSPVSQVTWQTSSWRARLRLSRAVALGVGRSVILSPFDGSPARELSPSRRNDIKSKPEESSALVKSATNYLKLLRFS